MSKTCARCSLEKPVEGFNKRTASPDGLHPYCRSCQSEKQKGYYRASPDLKARILARNKENRDSIRLRVLGYLKSHPCVDCGEADPVVLDFDHVRGKKRDSVGMLLRNGCSWATIKTEIAKCQVRCANCHRRKTGVDQRWFKALPQTPK